MNNSLKKVRLVVTNWDEECPISVNKGHSETGRKVLTRGIKTSEDFGDQHRQVVGTVMVDVIESLLQGYEYRFVAANGDAMLRLFPCVNKDLKTVFVAAQTMGSFRKLLSDKKVKRYVKGKEASLAKALDVRRQAREKCMTRLNVTPSQVVTCPNCGTEFRVGKELK